VTPARRVALLAAGAAAYCTAFFPNPQFRRWVRELVGNQMNAGPWVFVRHLVVQTTMVALACALVWWLLARRGWLPPIRESLHLREPRRILAWAAIMSAAIIAFTTVTILATGGTFAPHVPRGWDVLGNVFSNFYEQLIFTGFLFVVLREVTGSDAAAVVGVALLFGAVHTQYPLELRASIAISALLMGVARVKTGTIWTVWLVHMAADIVLDALFF